ncbi:MAG: ppx [Betaproteobacteria bacterium]|nr:ppx [Betaproteobacteria bacterium]
MAVYSSLAAVDLGSNSFHLQVARVVGDQIYPLDSLRDPIRLGAGLNREKRLDEDSQNRALDCLKRFGERLRGFDPHGVRAVGTNSLRVAKNAAGFLKQAEAALGFPIEVVAGREEARLIYVGVAHSLPVSKEKRLVIDIGGGSTEFIIGRGLKPLRLDSLYMGCVSYSLKYFPGGEVTKAGMKQAELAARNELQTMVAGFSKGQWHDAVGSSGSARALAEILQLNGFSESGITPDGLDRLRSALIKAGGIERLDVAGLKSDRLPVLPGGLAIMNAALSELGIESMQVASGSMRQGILYDLLGRFQHHDMRDMTVSQFMQRYQVDSKQARRVASLALSLYRQLTAGAEANDDTAPHYIAWAAKLHEIGISVAYSGYHKHSAYIVQNADMPGFSKMEQWRLATLLLAHRRSLKRIFTHDVEIVDWRMVMSLRLAALIYRSRTDIALPDFAVRVNGGTVRLGIALDWLASNPLTVTALQEEIDEWSAAGFKLDIKSLRELEAGIEAQAA